MAFSDPVPVGTIGVTATTTSASSWRGASLLNVIAFSNELEKKLGRTVDIAYEDYMSDRFRQRVERDRLLIYEA